MHQEQRQSRNHKPWRDVDRAKYGKDGLQPVSPVTMPSLGSNFRPTSTYADALCFTISELLCLLLSPQQGVVPTAPLVCRRLLLLSTRLKVHRLLLPCSLRPMVACAMTRPRLLEALLSCAQTSKRSFRCRDNLNSLLELSLRQLLQNAPAARQVLYLHCHLCHQWFSGRNGLRLHLKNFHSEAWQQHGEPVPPCKPSCKNGHNGFRFLRCQ